MVLRYLRADSAEVLSDFECGIQNMDTFIHSSLSSFLEYNPRYMLDIVETDNHDIVGLIVTSAGGFVDYDDEFHDYPNGKPWTYWNEEWELKEAVRFPTLEIDYLAVRKDLRGNGIGTEIVEELSRRAKKTGCFFLTVDAYHDTKYTAIPFYEKCGFFALQEYSEDSDSLRMALRL